MKKIIKKALWLLIVWFCLINNATALDINENIPKPTWLKLVKEVIDPAQGPTQLSFSYDKADEFSDISNYQIFYWKTLGSYPNKTKVSSGNPTTFLMGWVKWETYYFVIQARKIWRNSWKSNFSNPLKVIIWWEQSIVSEQDIVKPKSNDNKEIKKDEVKYIPKKLPVTWPEHILLFILALVLSIFLLRRNKKA
jgi:hypothetical protein